jgi:hypothetical protein
LNKRTRPLIAFAAVAAGISALAVAGSAAPPGGPHLSDVSTPNTKAVGVAPASKLSTELRQIAQAQGSAAPAAGAGSSSFSRTRRPTPANWHFSTRATSTSPASTTPRFLSKDKITFVEDAGDTLHSQRNALDSGYVFDLKTDYSNVSNQPLRWLAERRDPSATIDSSFSFSKNEGDNEITGTTVSDGDPSPNGLLGASIPSLFDDGWRWFYTQQHGDNTTWEVVPSSSNHGEPND